MFVHGDKLGEMLGGTVFWFLQVVGSDGLQGVPQHSTFVFSKTFFPLEAKCGWHIHGKMELPSEVSGRQGHFPLHDLVILLDPQ